MSEQPPDDAAQQAVLKALSNPQYRWRTIDGVAKETKLDADVVRAAIERAIGSTVVVAPLPSAEGARLFSTREHLLNTASLGEKFVSAFKNRVI